jgi:hypothetical protein
MIVNMVAPWGTKYHYMSGIHTNVTTVQLPSGQAWYSYLWDKPQNGGNDPVNCVSVPSAVTVSGWREGGIGSMSTMAILRQPSGAANPPYWFALTVIVSWLSSAPRPRVVTALLAGNVR